MVIFDSLKIYDFQKWERKLIEEIALQEGLRDKIFAVTGKNGNLILMEHFFYNERAEGNDGKKEHGILNNIVSNTNPLMGT